MGVHTQRLKLFQKGFRADAKGVRFPGGVNVRQNHMVGEGQGLCEVLKEGFGTGVGVGLEHAPDFPVGILPGGLKGGGDLRGVMGVVVHHRKAVDFPFVLEAAARAARAFKTLWRPGTARATRPWEIPSFNKVKEGLAMAS